MADIQSAAQWIGRLLVEEARYLYKIEGKVKELRDEVEWMQCFLRDADASQFDNAMARRWVAQIREFAYEAEDIIEKFLVRVVPHSRGRSDLLSHVKKYFHILWEIGAVHRIGSNIDNLKDKISSLTSRLHTYGIKLQMGDSSSSWQSNLREETYLTSKEEEMVGRDDLVEDLVGKLVDGKTRVFAICGEGGIGKTFLAQKIFQDPLIRRNFEAFAWAYVSQPCQISSVQQKLLSKLASKSSEQVAQMTDVELKDELHKIVRKWRCLVVLDGVWAAEVWDSLAEDFPISNQDFKSKILITTRIQEVAMHVDQDVHSHVLEPLDKKQARQLLETKVQGAPFDDSGEKATGGTRQGSGQKDTPRFSIKALSCLKRAKEREANKLKDEMLEHCGGLPLAIVVLGGVLSTKKTLEEWKTVHKNINSYFIDQEEVPSWKRILELSYYDLPYQLKTAFLYLGYFPINLEIPKRKITQLWEAEGLVSSGEDDMTPEDTLQDVAESCLAELVERSLVQVGSRGLSGKVKTCRLHYLMQELCMSKASKANWLNIVQLGTETDPSSSSSSPSSKKSSKSSTMVKRRFRRLAIYCSESLEKLPSDYRHAKYIRSLLFFNTLKSDDVLISLKKQALRKAFNDFKLLRVLDIENIEVQSLPDEVGFLIHLRYLSLKGSSVSKLPSTIRYLRCLQTLDLRVLSFVQLRIPNVLWRMDRLVHLYLPSKSFVLRHKALKLQLQGLICLETLANFSNSCQEQDIAKLKNLRKFSSCEFLSKKDIIDFLAPSNSPLRHLEHISLRLDVEILKIDPQTLADYQKLRKLWLKGQLAELTCPVQSSSPILMLPKNLVVLSLCYSELQNDPMPALEKLHHLKRLSLEENSYTGTIMTCSSGGFQELNYLTLKGLACLEKWQVNQGAMSKLVSLEITDCTSLKTLPKGLRFVKSLQELTLAYMPLSFYQNWVPVKDRKEWPDYRHVQHVPDINVFHVLDDRR